MNKICKCLVLLVVAAFVLQLGFGWNWIELTYLDDTTRFQKHTNKQQINEKMHVHNLSAEYPVSNIDKNALYQRILNKFPWVQRTNTLPNFYLTEKNSDYLSSSYSNATIVFMHNQKSGGTTAKQCLRSLARTCQVGRPVLVCNKNAGLYYSEIADNNNNDTKLQKFYFGGHTFRICDYTTQPCGYFTVIRNPYDRLISSYEFCKDARGAYQCRVDDARIASLKEWAIVQGSFLFRQFLYTPDICIKKFDSEIEKIRLAMNVSMPTRDIPCWYRNKLWIDSLATAQDKLDLLEYVLDHLHVWFAVIGITQEYEKTFELLEGAFKLPFVKLCGGGHSNYHAYQAEGEQSNLNRSAIVTRLKRQLMSDPVVREILYYDLRIYEKAKEIYVNQKEIHSRIPKTDYGLT
ncbi:uncharacterized protein LOC144349989 [Saccoglossus kowalevskii]